MTCRDLMTANPSCCVPEDPALRAAEIMKNENVGPVPVVASRGDQRVVGIVTDRDLAIRLIAEGRAPEATAVDDVMSRNPVTCRADADVSEAMEAMSRHQVRRIPVVDDEGRLCGIVAQADIARHLDERAAGEVLEDVSQPGRGIGRAFRPLREGMRSVRESQGSPTGLLVAAATGLLAGAGLMAVMESRRRGPREHAAVMEGSASEYEGGGL